MTAGEKRELLAKLVHERRSALLEAEDLLREIERVRAMPVDRFHGIDWETEARGRDDPS